MWTLGKQTMVLKGETDNGIFVAYHPGGELLASRGWHERPAALGHPHRPADPEPTVELVPTLEFDRTGRWLSVDPTQEKVRILEVADAAECRTLVREPFREDDRHGALAIDPTGRRAVTGIRRDRVGPAHRGDPGHAARQTASRGPLRHFRRGLDRAARPAPMARHGGGRWRDARSARLRCSSPRHRVTASRSAGTAARFAAAMYGDGGLVFDAPIPRTRPLAAPARHVRLASPSAPTANGRSPARISVQRGMKLWDARTGRLVHDFPGVSEEVGGSTASVPTAGGWPSTGMAGCSSRRRPGRPRVRLFRGPSVDWRWRSPRLAYRRL